MSVFCEVEATLTRCYIKFATERFHYVKFFKKILNVPGNAPFPLPLSVRAIRLLLDYVMGDLKCFVKL